MIVGELKAGRRSTCTPHGKLLQNGSSEMFFSYILGPSIHVHVRVRACALAAKVILLLLSNFHTSFVIFHTTERSPNSTGSRYNSPVSLEPN